MKNKSVTYTSKTSEDFIFRRMVEEKANGYIKKGTFTNELVWGHNSYIFPCMDKKRQMAFKKGMFLFGMVRKDVKIYLKSNVVKLPKKYGQIEYTKELNEELFGKITATDLNHAYWRIAYNLNIISENTYQKGLNDQFKAVRLAALSTMGANKKYQIIKDGKIIDEYKIVYGDDNLKDVYKLIRLTCYKYMNQVKKKLGKDFLCYKTDCIYYIDNQYNRKIVNDFFKEKDLYMKQLV
jgi:hypothetical protein